MHAFAAGSKWPPSLGESLATELTWYGCTVPNMGCVKYNPEITVRRCSPCTVTARLGASIPMGQGDTSPQYLDWGDMITNVPPQYF